MAHKHTHKSQNPTTHRREANSNSWLCGYFLYLRVERGGEKYYIVGSRSYTPPLLVAQHKRRACHTHTHTHRLYAVCSRERRLTHKYWHSQREYRQEFFSLFYPCSHKCPEGCIDGNFYKRKDSHWWCEQATKKRRF